MNNINFIKANGIGNDFAIFELSNSFKKEDYSLVSNKYSNRRLGIGFDQAIFIEKSDTNHEFNIKFFNADGSEAEACGNGTRCVAKYLMLKNNIKQVKLKTLGGLLECFLEPENYVRVKMPYPKLELIENNQSLTKLSALSAIKVEIGNPHLVCFVENPDSIEQYGKGLEEHPAFPFRTNVNFAKIINRNEIYLRVWERGTGITLACGTGACASAFAAMHYDLCSNQVKVIQQGGFLTIELIDKDLYMIGSADLVFEGKILSSNI